MKLSIIIPVYRTQDTLKRCLDSVLIQSFTDYEILLVDDESPDGSPQLCDEYAQKDARIKVIHKKNGGLSDARNVGIAQAKGEYITFIDSDDAITKDTLQLLVAELQKYPQTDILEYPIMEKVGHPTEEHLLSFQPKEYNNAVAYWLGEKVYKHTYACNKIFKHNLFVNIQFPKGKTFEDVLTIPLLIGLIPSEEQDSSASQQIQHPIIRVTNVGMYLYHWNNQGITSNAKHEDLLNLYLGQTLSLLQIFKNKDIENKNWEYTKQYESALEDFMLNILNNLLDLYDLSGKYESHPPLISRVKWLSERIQLTSIKLKLLNILGYQRLCKLHHLITKLRKYL